jgi:carboxypeptidase C (cathepsin A)
VNVAETLRSAMTQNPQLRVFAANGYYDLATPYFATQYTFQHMGLDPTLRDHVTMGFYEAGHMMYIHKASIEKLKQDIAKFMQAAVK